MSSTPEDGQNNCPKHVELTGIINKPLLLHLVVCLYYLYEWCTVKQISDNEIYLLVKYMKNVLWRITKCLSYIEDARRLKVNFSLHRIWKGVGTPLFQLPAFMSACSIFVVFSVSSFLTPNFQHLFLVLVGSLSFTLCPMWHFTWICTVVGASWLYGQIMVKIFTRIRSDRLFRYTTSLPRETW